MALNTMMALASLQSTFKKTLVEAETEMDLAMKHVERAAENGDVGTDEVADMRKKVLEAFSNVKRLMIRFNSAALFFIGLNIDPMNPRIHDLVSGSIDSLSVMKKKNKRNIPDDSSSALGDANNPASHVSKKKKLPTSEASNVIKKRSGGVVETERKQVSKCVSPKITNQSKVCVSVDFTNNTIVEAGDEIVAVPKKLATKENNEVPHKEKQCSRKPKVSLKKLVTAKSPGEMQLSAELCNGDEVAAVNEVETDLVDLEEGEVSE